MPCIARSTHYLPGLYIFPTFHLRSIATEDDRTRTEWGTTEVGSKYEAGKMSRQQLYLSHWDIAFKTYAYLVSWMISEKFPCKDIQI